MKRTIDSIRRVSVSIVCIIALMSMYTGKTLADDKAAKITFEEPKHDFGKVKAGVDLAFVYKFKNTGTAQLLIQQVHPSCGCTGASIGDKKEFAPDEAGEIKVTFSTAGRSGIQNKTVTVQSNDAEHPFVALSFTCEIIIQQP